MSAVIHATVLLRHDLPDGSHHFDWLLDLAGNESAPLTTFRLPAPIHELAVDEAMSAVRIADHRRAYLEYEGPVSGDRGCVRQVARGAIRSAQRQPARWELVIAWTAGRSHTQSVAIAFEADSSAATGDEQPCRVFCLSQSAENA